jgi:serine/threonine protein phosphatase PrpC
MTDTPETAPAQTAAAPPAANGAETNTSNETAGGTEKPAPPDAQAPSPPLAVAATETRVEPSPNAAPVDDALVAARAAAEWRVIGETVPGASHLRAGIPNQDAILYVRQSSARLPLIVSISDGHGSNKCFRSDRGSRFAVRTGADLLDELIHGRHAALPPAELESRVRERLTREFVKRWRAAVEADLKREPFREEEFARMVEKDGANARRLVEANPYLAYGATSLSVLLTPTYALYLQLGDGEIINVSAQGEIKQPLPEDARLLANETTSLCLDKAAEDFLFAVYPHGAGDLPALILLTTDGYYNSFSTTAGFHQVGSDLIQMLRDPDGFGTVNRSVKSWLEEATAAGSGDDCTLAIICRMDALTASPSSSETPSTTSNTSTGASPEVAASPDAAVKPAPAASHEQPAAPKTA